jgi:hypothetical protein
MQGSGLGVEFPCEFFAFKGSSPSDDVSASLSLSLLYWFIFIFIFFSLLVFYSYFLRFNILCLLISLDLENHECLGTRDTALKQRIRRTIVGNCQLD